jgi:ABC-type phosphate/phosphonate transport system substrate-binding protein
MTDILLGAVAYDPKVVTIWEGFKAWFAKQGLAFDYVLYSNYDRQVDELIDGRIDVAWNSPLAWVRARRVAAAKGVNVSAIAMRDSDCDLTSVVVVRGDSGYTKASDLEGEGKVVGAGAWDSPQATLLPLALLGDVQVRHFNVGVGLHGDHVGGERDAAKALAAGEVDAACMIDGNHLVFTRDGTLPANTRIVAQTPPYDHCNMTVGPAASPDAVARFLDLLLAMSYSDAEVRPLLDLEGLKEWRPGRTTGYDALERAVDATGFYDEYGHPRPG